MKSVTTTLRAVAVLAAISAGPLWAQDRPGYPSAFPYAFPANNGPVFVSAFASPNGPAVGPGYVAPSFASAMAAPPAYVSGAAFASVAPGLSAGGPAAVFPAGYNGPAAAPPGALASDPSALPAEYPSDPAVGGVSEAPQAAAADTPKWLPHMSFMVGGIFLARPCPKAVALAFDFLSGDEALNAHDMPLGWGEGARIDGIWQVNNEWGAEVVYFGIDNWSQSASISGIGFVAPQLSTDFLFTDITAQYQSALYSGELNLRHVILPRFSLLMGFRYLELRDRLSLTGDSQVGPGYSTTKLTNNLYGFQIGADASIIQAENVPFHIQAYVKAGIFGNSAVRTEYTTGPDGESAFRDSIGQASLVGEVAFLPTYDFTSHVSIFGGYTALFLQGVAEAPKSLDTTESIHAGHFVFCQGAQVGLQVKW